MLRCTLWQLQTDWCAADSVCAWVQEDDDVWVTVYGFQPSQQHLIMKEFSKCGDILKFGDGHEDGTNWVHIQFAVGSQCPVLP